MLFYYSCYCDVFRLDCVKALLTLNVPCGVRNFANKTPYELARDAGHSDCAEELDKYRYRQFISRIV